MSQQQRPPTDQHVGDLILKRVQEVFARYGRYIILAVAAVGAGLAGWYSYHSRSRQEAAQSWQDLMQAPPVVSVGHQRVPPEQIEDAVALCQAILESGWTTQATPWVLLKLGNAQRAAGRPEQALDAYRRLQREFSRHYAAALATPAAAGALEEAGHYAEAAKAYEALAAGDENDGKASPFLVDAARAWELARDRQAAIEAYRRYQEAAGEDTPLAELTATRLRELNEGKPLLPMPPPEPPQPPAPEAPAEPPPLPPEAPAEPPPLPPEAPDMQTPEPPLPPVPPSGGVEEPNNQDGPGDQG